MENKTKVQIWSKWKGQKPYLYGEYEDLKEACKIMSNFIWGTLHDQEYIVKIITK